MRGRLFGMACCVLASCTAGSPAFAQQCVSAERVLEQIEEVRPLGVRVVTFPRDEAAAVLAVLTENGAPPPAGLKVDAVIMVIGDRAAVLLFVDGDKICQKLAVPLKAAEMIEQTVRGRAV